MKMAFATIRPRAIVLLKDLDPYAGVTVKQAPRAVEHFVSMSSRRALAEYWILLWMLLDQSSIL